MQKWPITIFTPTYNRAYILKPLYCSLVEQTNKNFCWVVIDDGSTDDTEQLVRSFIEEGIVDIRYYKQTNGGKQRAQNLAVEYCDTELFYCVDSDDYLPTDAVDSILKKWDAESSSRELAGIIALRGSDEITPLGTWLPEGVEYSTVWDLYFKYHHKGDIALIYRTDILRSYPYPVEPGEKFIAETYSSYLIDQKYEMALLQKVTWICKYLPDGYTHNARKITRENPIGYMRIKRLYIELATDVALRFESTVLFLVGAYFAGSYWKYWRTLPNKIEAGFAILPSILLANTEFRR